MGHLQSLTGNRPGAGKSDFTAIRFQVRDNRDRHCVDLLNQVEAASSAELILTASSDGKVDMREVCRKLDPIVQASNLRESEKFEVRSFLASQSLQAKKAASRG